MKNSIKWFLKILGRLLYQILELPILILISDVYLFSKMNKVKTLKTNGLTLKFSTPNFLTRYRANTFFTKEPDTLEWIESFDKKSVFYDIGANVGLYSIYAGLIKKSRVFCFEPSVFNLEILAKNIYLNNLVDNLTIIPIALNDKIKVSNLKLSNTEVGGAHSTFDKDFDGDGKKMSIKFEYNTIGFDLNSFVDKSKLPLPDHIKIDVDGLEHFILKGGNEVIKNAKSILVEINDDFESQKKVSENILRNCGFELSKKNYADTDNKPIFNQIWKKIN